MTFRLRDASRLSDRVIQSIYAGNVYVFRDVPEMHEIARRTRSLINSLAGASPLGANLEAWQQFFSSSPEAIHAACDAYESDEEISELFRGALHRCGAHPSYDASVLTAPPRGGRRKRSQLVHMQRPDHLWDRVRLRVQPFGDNHPDDISNTERHGAGRYSTSLPIHRDTWGSNIPQQLNWWAPLVPVSPERTLLLYPQWFDRPVANTSSDWDFEQLKKHRADGRPYPQLPVLDGSDDPDLMAALARDATPVLVDPGDLVVFSGAHLHGSSSNIDPASARLPRISTEVRTLRVRDFEAAAARRHKRRMRAAFDEDVVEWATEDVAVPDDDDDRDSGDDSQSIRRLLGAANVDGDAPGVPGVHWFKDMTATSTTKTAVSSSSAGASAPLLLRLLRESGLTEEQRARIAATEAEATRRANARARAQAAAEAAEAAKRLRELREQQQGSVEASPPPSTPSSAGDTDSDRVVLADTDVMVLSLPRDVCDAQLRELFLPFGEVRNATIVIDERSGSSKGFGFVTMAGKEAAAEAVRRLHKTRVPSSFSDRRQKIRVKLSNITGHGRRQAGSGAGGR